MKLKDKYTVYKGRKLTIQGKKLLVENHYSKSHRVVGNTFFYLKEGNKVIGVAVFGHPTSSRAKAIYGDCLELKKFCIIDETPKNTESFFLGNCIRSIKKLKNKPEKILTYADPNAGHEGTIYKATNFDYKGQGKANMFFVAENGKEYHQRAIYQKNKEGYIKSAIKLQSDIKNGILKKKKNEGKHIYLYTL